MVDLRVETDGIVRVQGFTRHSGIAEFDENVRRALDGFRAPSIPAEVSATALRIVFDHSVESPIVR